MGFTTPCFIRKNTPELRKKLEILGYKLNNGKWMGKCLATFRIKETKEWRYVATTEWDLQNNPDIDISIDCGTNEEFFLGIAALRDDTDDSQWFTDGEDWFLCQYLKVGMHYQDKPEILFDKWHKSSVDELIEHFKQ